MGNAATKNINAKRAGLHMSLCAGIIGIVGVFALYGMGSLALMALGIAAVILVLDVALRGLGRLAERRLNVTAGIKRGCLALLVLLDVLVALCGLIYAVQDSMLFLNVDDEESREWLQGRPDYHEVEFTAENGKTYHGMMYQAGDEKAPLVIYFGGNGEVSYSRLRGLAEQGQWQYFDGYQYLFIDYEGYGLNDGQASYLNMYEESLAVYDYAASLPNVDSSHIVAMGYSLGTGSAVYLAAHRPVAGLVLAAPYANGYDLYNGMLPVFVGPLRLLVTQQLPSDEYAPDVACPVLVIASHSDETVPFASSERLSGLFPGKVDFLALDQVSHNGIFSGDGVYGRVQSFLEEAASS